MASTIKTTFNETPKTLNGVHMVDTNGVFPFTMIDNAVSVSEFLNVVISSELSREGMRKWQVENLNRQHVTMHLVKTRAQYAN